ncbi:MAG TPA: ATP-binding protein [Candidatus Kapabacteria bacterium]|nr:ATP-binding protein [Candidatus Kapabacteria bacterium]
MKNEIKFTQRPAFINRQYELAFLRAFIQDTPNRLLFMYGPKSSGKTTLLIKFVEEIEKSKIYNTMFFNLRELLICSYKDFIQVFFEPENTDKENRKKIEYDLKVFKISFETIKQLENNQVDPFKVMKMNLEHFKSQGIIPIIIIDELQALSEIYFNGQRELLKELFNFFVAMTKESHLCHVIISSSDGYFIERIYSDSKLQKTSTFLEVDYLEKDDIFYWLNNLEKESGITAFTLTQEQIEIIWHYFGGSIWEIYELLSHQFQFAKDGKVSNEDIISFSKAKIKAFAIKFQDYAKFNPFKIKLLKISNKYFIDKDSIILMDFDLFAKQGDNYKYIADEIGSLVQKNLFSYNPVTGEYKPQGHSIQLGLELYCKDYAI